MPLPDEIDSSYLGRLLRVNGCGSDAEIMCLLRQWSVATGDVRTGLARTGRGSQSRLGLLARCANMDLSEFVHKHTTLQLRRAFTQYRAGFVHASDENYLALVNYGMRPTRPGAYFCTECFAGDQIHFGMSYWRRDHQLPGMNECSRHRKALSYVQEISAFLEAPSCFESRCYEISETSARSHTAHPGIQRFLSLSREFMLVRQPIDRALAHRVIHERRLVLGFSQTERGVFRYSQKSLLSDEIFSKFPRDWLISVVPEFVEKVLGVYLKKVDRFLHKGTASYSTNFYILACIVLFESSDEVINSLNLRPGIGGRTIALSSMTG